MLLCNLQIMKNLSYHLKKNFWTKMRKVATDMATTLWQVVKDYTIPLAV